MLTQAEGVAWMPLEDQERLLDEDERRREEEMGILASDSKTSNSKLPKPCIQANQTIALPNEDDFERMAKLSSTPHTGRAFQVKGLVSKHMTFEKTVLCLFQVEQDENTCAVDIIYRQAMGPPAPPSPCQEDPAAPAQGSLSPIVETSREYYRSSSSSGSDTLHSKTPHGDKSHWGNTQHQVHCLSFFCMFLALRRQPPCLGRGASLETSPPPLSRALPDISWHPVMQPVGTWGIKVAT